MPWPSDSVLTLQPHPYGKAAFEKVGVHVVSIWWRRGESNPRPKTLQQELLRAQTVICIPAPQREPSHSGAW